MSCDLRSVPQVRFVIPKEDLAYTPLTHLRWFTLNNVPTSDDHRSLYFHALNVVLEDLCGNDDEPPQRRDGRERADWEHVFSQVRSHWLAERHAMSATHRQLLWIVLLRIQFILHRNTKEHGNIHTAEFAQRRYLQQSVHSIRRHSVNELWKTLYALHVAWKTLTYSADLRTYTEAILTQVARFAWIALADRRVFNHPAYVDTVAATENVGVRDASGEIAFRDGCATATYCVNASFLRETERVFHVFVRDLDLHRVTFDGGLGYEVCRAERATSYERFVTWMEESVSVEARREGVAEAFEVRVYERRALPGEVERFAEKDPHQLHDAYNAIACLRPDVLDTTAELIAHESNIEDLLAKSRDWEKNATEEHPFTDPYTPKKSSETSIQARRRVMHTAQRDGDVTDVVLSAVSLTLDGMFASDEVTFMTWFTSGTLPLPAHKRILPMLVYVCNQWHVAFDTRVYRCITIIDAVECWIRLLCASDEMVSSLAHVAPNVDVLFEAYRTITGEVSPAEEARLAAEISSSVASAVRLPTCYT